jgi:hypothetical protein
MDNFLYKYAIGPMPDIDPVIEKEVLYVQDQNGGSYSGQIQIDTSSLGRNGRWLAWSDSYIEIPFTFSMAAPLGVSANPLDGDSAINTFATAFSAGLKNGYFQIIDSMKVEYSNQTVVQQTSFTNIHAHFKTITSFSQDDLKKWGPSIGFNPDSAGSMVYADHVAAAGGDGYSNNRDLTTLATFTAPENFNSGFLERRRQTTAFPLAGYNGITAAGTVAIGKNNYYNSTPAVAGGTAGVVTWSVLCTIRLKDIADFFDKIPLIKGGFMRITINYNSCSENITIDAANGGSMVISANGHTQLSGNTNPLLFGNGLTNNSMAAITARSGNAQIGARITLACGVGNSNAVGGTGLAVPFNTCRLYVPSYVLNPVYEAQIYNTFPSGKEFAYNDVYQYNFNNIGNGQTFNQLLTNGQEGLKYVVCIPFATPGNAGNVFLNVSIPTYQSPFDTAPATTRPLSQISQFNVQVGGKNIFQRSLDYTFENFIQEMSAINAINGGASTGITSGLIGQYEWENAYCYLVADLSRRLPEEDNVPKSVLVQGKNNTGVSLDFVCFVVYEKKLTLDMRTGEAVRRLSNL